jgi:hypothetical protein
MLIQSQCKCSPLGELLTVYAADGEEEVSALLLQARTTTNEDQKTKKLHAFLEPVQMHAGWSL